MMQRGYAQPPDRERDRLIAEHVDMARRIALRLARRLPPWLREEDLVGAAMIGLTEAADRYDPARGEPFVGFAEKRVRGAVVDELRRGDLLPRRVRGAARKVTGVIAGLEHALGRSPDDDEVARALGVSVEEYRDELALLVHVGFVEFDGQESRDGDVAAAGGSPESSVERAQLVARLRTCIDELDERDATVLSLYYVEELGLAEVGEVLGVSESRVCQLHARAIVRLRARFEDEER
jgi:RNA polymerase sigma factor for flagellar operon FliA